MRSRAEQLLRWLFFGVAVALMPLVARYLTLQTYNRTANLETVVSNGELLLISTGVAAGGIGELLATNRNQVLLKLLAGGTCVLFVLGCSFYFGAIGATTSLDTRYIMTVSVRLFAGTVLASGLCLYLAHEETRR